MLIAEWKAAPYLTFWHFGKLFGFLSTIASGYIIVAVAPPALVGYWNGRNEAVANLAAGIAPLIFAPMYDAIGNARGQEMLGATAAVSFLATLCYMPVIPIMPNKKKTKEEKDEEMKDLEEYKKLSDDEFMQLPMEIIDNLTMMQIEAGEQPRLVSWGSYSKQRHMLDGVQERALKDFQYLNQAIVAMLTSRELMVQEQENWKKAKDLVPKCDRDNAKDEMGTWIADYFDDAGYENWETQTTIYKAMFMNAFPPIDALDDVKPDYASMPLNQWEDNLMKFLSVMDTHIGHFKRRQKVGVSATMLRKR